MGKEKFMVLVFALFFLAVPAYASYLDYSILPDCSECNEGDSVVFRVTAKYDVPRLYDEQVEAHGNDTELEQILVSKVTIKNIELIDSEGNVFAESDADLQFGAEHTGIDAFPKSVDLLAVLPEPKGNFLYFYPCFEIEHEMEVRRWDFIDGDFDSEYYAETGELCSKTNDKLFVRAIDPCSECGFSQLCTENGCKFNYWFVLGPVLVFLVVLGLIYFRPRKKKPIF